MQRPRLLMFGAANDDEVYGIGGTKGDMKHPTKFVDIFDIRMQRWRTGEDLNYARNEGAAIFLERDLYVIGGFDSEQRSCAMERLEANNPFWQTHITDGTVDARCFHNVVKIHL